MRLILIGPEYVGKTTLANALRDWGKARGRVFHMDDGDFTIPDYHHLNKAEQEAMVALPPVLKERFQRMVIYYHLDVISRWEDCILGGYHIEQKIYGPRYYHPGIPVTFERYVESKLPHDTILVNMTAKPDVIRARMKAEPHPYQLLKPSEVEEVQAEFEREFFTSWITRKVTLDTSYVQPEQLLKLFLQAVRPKLNTRDLLLTGEERI
ncbi:MAG: hypothetical protein FJ319_07725 [SAR202 cluster bacterium]|nr:hypothetical protein [SAR202 cluster bacterium]